MTTQITRWARSLAPLAFLLAAPLDAASHGAVRPHELRVERVVALVRHGVRAPISGEVPEGTRTDAPWPRWPVAPERLTPRGARALRIEGALARRWLDSIGLTGRGRCPAAGQVSVWTNTAERTIASGAALAEGLAPGCAVPIGHRDAGAVDPLFEPLRAGAAPFDARAAIESVQAYTGGVERMADRYGPQRAELDRALGCGDAAGCSPSAPATLRPSADGRAIELSGPIRDVSGTAQVLLLQYAEGLTARTPWSRVDAAALRRLGALHAALFDVFSRSPYMAARQAGPLARRVEERLTARDGPAVELLVGHDTNVTALAAVLGVTLTAPGYAAGDVAPGGALVLELLRGRGGARFVRATYRTQSPTQLRRLARDGTVTRLAVPGCASGPERSCPLGEFVRLLRGRTAG
ncbi:histidine-type phosphatase [Sphingomonas yunnanensis]|uniref:histidine-type phosphatase n=1 Tax=Sphingomonas yunnanensis TaxID=310400 RepID=UPI001CA7A72E|nr:histidine-type phosphatase [Sphingomonas yunnanensis]MBY9063019.1 histidine-type phosphatase [Sphingomonas yunnanensis]